VCCCRLPCLFVADWLVACVFCSFRLLAFCGFLLLWFLSSSLIVVRCIFLRCVRFFSADRFLSLWLCLFCSLLVLSVLFLLCLSLRLCFVAFGFVFFCWSIPFFVCFFCLWRLSFLAPCSFVCLLVPFLLDLLC